MARFYMEVQGKGKPVHRLGARRGMGRISVQGWDAGVTVIAGMDDLDHISFDVNMTSGSNGGPTERLGIVHLTNAGLRWEPSSVPDEKLYVDFRTEELRLVEQAEANQARRL